MQIMKIAVIGQVVLGSVTAGVALTRPSAKQAAATAEHAKADHKGAVAKAAAEEGKGKKDEHGKLPVAGAAKEVGKDSHAAEGHAAAGHAAAPAADPHAPAAAGAPAAPPEAAAAPDGEEEALGDNPRMIAKRLLEGNRRFMKGQRTAWNLSAQRESSAKGQHPSAMVLGCADSRVSPELLFDRGIGEIFVVRSAGNIAEPVATGSLEYAAEHLHAKVLIVMGHEKCGAVQAALAEQKMPTPNLEAVMGYISPAVKGLKSWAEGNDLIHMAVEANVQRQADELLKLSPVLRKAVQGGHIALLKAVYDIETGRVRPLP